MTSSLQMDIQRDLIDFSDNHMNTSMNSSVNTSMNTSLTQTLMDNEVRRPYSSHNFKIKRQSIGGNDEHKDTNCGQMDNELVDDIHMDTTEDTLESFVKWCSLSDNTNDNNEDKCLVHKQHSNLMFSSSHESHEMGFNEMVTKYADVIKTGMRRPKVCHQTVVSQLCPTYRLRRPKTTEQLVINSNNNSNK
ncbi:uncharacterized protein LOC128958059 [Oppia nitens]|uniref:uncharacterized protein LOC128958059 n=1 Tax=Oppia nitens TaxID=1686743 RepID=UPI0023DC99CA|nr:uncharacterized protein LOC128958059 [Oppia nitens]